MLFPTLLAASLAVGETVQPMALLVVMRDTGRVERYALPSGRHEGTFIWGVPDPNGIALGPDGDWYLSTGAIGGGGTVVRCDGRTGRVWGEFVAPKRDEPGYLARGTGLAFHEGDLYVASCDNGKIIRYDGRTGAWVADFATGSVGGITQIEFREDVLYSADFHANAIRKYDGRTGEALGELTTRPGFCPWGLAFDAAGDLFWSGSDHTIQRFAGQANETWVDAAPGREIPLRLAIGPDGNLYCAHCGGNTVTVWSTQPPKPEAPLLVVQGPEVRQPIALGFTDLPLPERRIHRLEAELTMPRSANARAKAVVRLEADPDTPQLLSLGWDTEGGDRARHNLLRSPAALRVRIGDRWQRLPVRCERPDDEAVRYSLELPGGGEIGWEVAAHEGALEMRFGGEGMGLAEVQGMELVLPFDPKLCATTVLTGDWTRNRRARLPFLISAPDLGQMLVTCERRPRLRARCEGSRPSQWVTLTFELPVPVGEAYSLRFEPWLLPPPPDLRDTSRWAAARRGWFNLLQLSAAQALEGASGQTPPGIWANNVISDPVSSVLYMLADHALLVPEPAPGVSVPAMLRRTVDFWLEAKTDPDGRIWYVANGPSEMMDSNPAVLIGAWAYVEATGDVGWLAQRIERLEFISAHTEARDVDGDGLVESRQSGNRGTHAFGDTAWDTYSSGHKNAMVNLLAYRAWRGLADLEGRLGRAAQQEHYSQLADRIKASFRTQFHNPESGWLGFWRSEDGFLHDVNTDVITSMAVMYGLVTPEDGRQMLDRYWQELEQVGFARFDLGLPLNIRPVHRDDQFGEWGGKAEDGSDTFGQYLNGGCCVSNASFALVASYIVGREERADMILDAMLQRQQEGVFPNGGGFQNGVINRYPEGAEFFDWQGNTCGYEGHLVYSWAFLQAVLLREPQFRERLYRPLR